MDPSPYEVDITLAKALTCSTPGLKMEFLSQKQGWFLKAFDKSAKFHEKVGLLNPSKDIFPILISDLKELASKNDNFKIFSVPDCSRMVQENWDASPFYKIGNSPGRHIMFKDASAPDNLPKSKKNQSPIAVRKLSNTERLQKVILKMASQFHPKEPKKTQFMKLLYRMAKIKTNDFLEVILKENEKIIGGSILSNHHIFCYPLYDFIEREHRGRGLFYLMLAFIQEKALRESTRYLVGDILHESVRPAFKKIFERVGGKELYSRCFFSIDYKP